MIRPVEMPPRALPAPEDCVPETPSTRHRDYVLTDYEPACDPAGRLHSSTVLFHALRSYGLTDRLRPILLEVRKHLGADEAVWGFKIDGNGNPGLELYFYNSIANRVPHPKSATTLKRVLARYMEIDGEVDEAIPYFMCSIDLIPHPSPLPRAGEGIAQFRIYVRGERLRDGYDGISYRVDGRTLTLENYYTFYRAATDLPTVLSRLAASVHGGDESSRNALAPDYLHRSHTICYATKPRTDALYFSRIGTPELAMFLRRRMPGALANLFEEHAQLFAHLRWDVGMDFSIQDEGTNRAGPARIVKAGFYGLL